MNEQLENKKIVVIGLEQRALDCLPQKHLFQMVPLLLWEEMQKALKGESGTWCKGRCNKSEDATNISTAANAIETCIKTFGDFDALYHVAGGGSRKMGDGPLQ